MPETYLEHVRNIERELGPFAFRSERITEFTDGTDAFRFFEDEWRGAEGQARFAGRTPLMLERDRILYSDELRRQADKKHVLFFQNQLVSRDYTTQTLRVAHVARAICGRLRLNNDLGEAIALGCKVGGTPFLHVSKKTVDSWIRAKLRSIDTSQQPRDGTRHINRGTREPQAALLDPAGSERVHALPRWVQQIQSDTIRSDIARYIPWAAGNFEEPAYSSGQQSYWLLSTNPFLLVQRSPYSPQTMYGIWRHSLSTGTDVTAFRHEVKLVGREPHVKLFLSDSALTHEAIVVRYADDITWVIENLSEANRAAALFGKPNAIFGELALYLEENEMPDSLARGLQPVANPGRLYTYFIDDLVRMSSSQMAQGDQNTPASETEPMISLSKTAMRMLRLMKSFLDSNVFADGRIGARNTTLNVICETVLELLFESQAQALVELLRRRAKLEGWPSGASNKAESLADNTVHRLQACIDAFTLMSDREVFDFLGLESR